MIHHDINADQVAVLLVEKRAINPLSHRFQRALAAVLDRLEAAPRLRAVMLGFDDSEASASQSVQHLLALTAEQTGDCRAMLAAYQRLLERLEQLPVPVIAALTGKVAGHAAGLALACHRRFALGDTVLCMPQVHCGLVPAGGALVRAVRLAGVAAAIPLLTEGLPLNAQQGLGAGLIDGVAEDEGSLGAMARAALAAGLPPARTVTPAPDGAAWPEAVRMATARLHADAPHYPAPRAILAAIAEGAPHDMAHAMSIESKYFCQVATGATAKNLMRLHAASDAPPVAPALAQAFCQALLGACQAEADVLASEGVAPVTIELAAVSVGLPPPFTHAAARTRESDFAIACARLLYSACGAALPWLAHGRINAEQANLLSVRSCGFPAYTGGVIGFIDHVGLHAFITQARALANACGPRFAFDEALVELAARPAGAL